MEEPPAPASAGKANDGPENAMLVELEWKPDDGVGIPVLLAATIYDLGESVSEDDVPSRHAVHHDPAAENCELKVEFETGDQLVLDAETGWIVKGDS